jgi:hypothetical protein
VVGCIVCLVGFGAVDGGSVGSVSERVKGIGREEEFTQRSLGSRVRGEGERVRSSSGVGVGLRSSSRATVEGGQGGKLEIEGGRAGRFEVEGGGAGRLEIEGGRAGRFEVEGGGAGRLEIEGGRAGRFEVEGGGAGRLEIDSGKAGRLEIEGSEADAVRMDDEDECRVGDTKGARYDASMSSTSSVSSCSEPTLDSVVLVAPTKLVQSANPPRLTPCLLVS